MAAAVAVLARLRAVDQNGLPLAGAKLYTYDAGTSTLKTTYSDSALSVANANPLVADAGGLFGARYMSPGAYKEVLTTSGDANVYTQDNLIAQNVAPTVLSKSAAYTVTTSDGDDVLVLCDATSAAFTIALYTAVGNAGKRITVKKIDASLNAITLDPNSSETIDGASTASLPGQYDSVTLESNGTNWIVRATTLRTFIGVRVHRNATQTIATDTFTKVQFNTEDADPFGWFDNATNYRFLPTRAGWYRVSAVVEMINLSGRFSVAIYKNGSHRVAARWDTGGATLDSGGAITDLVNFNGSTDYIEIFAEHAAGADRTTVATRTSMAAEFVGAL